MQCRSPRYLRKCNMIVSCNNCFCCRVNRKRVWQTRIMLEADEHEHNSFVTLTYANWSLPTVVTHNGTIRGTLYPRDLQLFFKRLRRYAEYAGLKQKIRYFAVGEYGDKTWRPHYHICLFGLSKDHLSIIQKAWNKGIIHVGDITSKSAGYVVGYCEKKMTNPKDKRLFGRFPEFSRCSTRSGIAYNYVDKMVKALTPVKDKIDDVPSCVNLFGKLMPLGRYLKNKIRSALWGFVGAPPAILDKIKTELYLLQHEFINSVTKFLSFNSFLSSKYLNSGVIAEQMNIKYRLTSRSL